MSTQEILVELPRLRPEEREMIMSTIVRLHEEFEPSPAMEDAIREGGEEQIFVSTRELRS